MFFRIETGNGVPVYEQVARQITFAVANGSLARGELVPSVRQLARDLAINPNTVARAYRQLQELGILESIRGTGLAVAGGARAISKTERQRVLKERFAGVADEAVQTQLERNDILGLFETELDKQISKSR